MVTTLRSSSTNGEAAGSGVAHRPFAAGLAAQQARQCICAIARELGIGELDHLPGAVGALHRRGIGAGEHRVVGHRGQRAAVKQHAHAGVMPARGRPGGEIVERLADRRSARRLSPRAGSSRRRSSVHTASVPGQGSANTASRASTGGCSDGSVGRSSTCACTGPMAGGAAGARRRGGASASVEHFRIDRERAHGAAFGVADFLDFDQPPPSVDGQPDHVAERQRKPTRRQREFGALAAGPQILQPDFRAPLGFAVFGHHREVGMRGARRAADQAARARRRAPDNRRRYW